MDGAGGTRFRARMGNRGFTVAVSALAVVAFVWFHYITYTQYASNRVYLADAGVFDMLCASLRHGQFMRTPLHWAANVNYFADHFRPILLLVMPLYFVADHILTLLAVQNLALVGAAVPLCFFARRVLGNDLLALLVGGLYLANHFVWSVHLANHPESMAFVGFFAMFLAIESRRIWLYVAGFLWAAAVKEDMAIYLGLFGLALLPGRDPWRRRVGLATVAAAVAAGCLALGIRHLAGREAYVAAGLKPAPRLASMGGSVAEVALHIATHPLDIAGRVLRAPLLLLFATTGFAALLDFRTAWLVVVGAGLFMITDDPMVRELAYYYSYPAIPFLFHSTVRGLRRLLDLQGPPPWFRTRVVPGVLVLAVLGAFTLRTRTDGLPHMPFPVTPHDRLVDEIIKLIPPDAPVAVQYDYYVKVPNRPMKLPLRLKDLPLAEYVLLNFKTGRPADLMGEDKREELDAVVDTVNSGEFDNVFDAEGYYLLKRAETAPAE